MGRDRKSRLYRPSEVHSDGEPKTFGSASQLEVGLEAERVRGWLDDCRLDETERGDVGLFWMKSKKLDQQTA